MYRLQGNVVEMRNDDDYAGSSNEGNYNLIEIITVITVAQYFEMALDIELSALNHKESIKK